MFGRRNLVRAIQALSFESFMERLAEQPTEDRDEHWRPQSDFLLFRTYDDYFSLERFDDAKAVLRDRGLPILDTRARLGHHSTELEQRRGDFAAVSGREFAAWWQPGAAPEYRSLFNRRTRQLVQRIYSADLALYQDLFGRDSLLFQ